MNDEVQRDLDNIYRFTDFEFAYNEGFLPTSGIPVSRQWGGKYRCLHCQATGYINYAWVNDIHWWGNWHGNNCRKKV